VAALGEAGASSSEVKNPASGRMTTPVVVGSSGCEKRGEAISVGRREDGFGGGYGVSPDDGDRRR
jgi:hypothetical protein